MPMKMAISTTIQQWCAIRYQNRDDLVIDTKEQSPIGNGIATAQVLQGKFMGKTVTLGHAWTDDEGRLLVAGGSGN